MHSLTKSNNINTRPVAENSTWIGPHGKQISTEREWIAAVSRIPPHIRYNKSPSLAVQLAAVSRSGSEIKYINDPNEEVQMAAVTNDPAALRYIDNPTEAVQIAAIEQKPLLIDLVENPSEAMQMSAVTRDVYAIDRIANPTAQVQMAALRQTDNAILWIDRLAPEVLAQNDIKRIIMQGLLRDMKDLDTGGAELILEALRDAGCEWPELDIIEKSMGADNSLREDKDTGSNYRWRGEIYVRSSFIYGTEAVLETMLAYGITIHDMPEAAEWLEGRKHFFIQKLLRAVRDDDYATADRLVVQAREIGLDWPELVVVTSWLNNHTTQDHL